MNYNLSIKSLYELFKGYGEKRINIVIRRFKKEKTSYPLLQKQYGVDLKQRTGLAVMSYMETTRLQSILTRFEKLLKFVVKLEEEGKTEKEIINIIETKDEIVLYKYVENLISKKTEIITSSFNINKYIKDKKITLKVLADAVEGHDHELEKKVFKYHYGLNISKMDDDTIMTLLGINRTTLETYIRNVANNLDELLKKYQEFMSDYELTIDAKKSKRKMNSKKASKKEPIKEDNNQNKKIGNKSENKKFINYIITHLTLREEVEEIEAKIKEAVSTDHVKRLKSYQVAKKYYGEDLLREYKGSYNSQEDAYTCKELAKTIERYIKNGGFERKKKPKAKIEVKKHNDFFIEYFITSDISKGKSDVIAKNIYKILKDLEVKYEKAITLLKDMYDADYKTEYKLKRELTKGEMSSIRALVRKANEIIDAMMDNEIYEYEEFKDKFLIKKRKEKKATPSKYKTYFIEYFYEETPTLEELEILKSNILFIIENSDIKVRKSAIKLESIYGKNLDQEINLSNINKGTFKVLNSLVRKIKEQLINIEEFKKSKIKNISNFINTEGLNQEEKDKLINSIIEVLLTTYSESKPVLYLKEMFGETLKEDYIGTYDKKKAATIRSFFKTNMDKIKNGENKKAVYKTEFIEYLLEHSDEDNKVLIRNNYSNIVRYIIRNHTTLYDQLKNVYGENLEKKIDNDIVISNETKTLIKYFLRTGMKKIIDKKLYLQNPYNNIPISLYDAIETSKRQEEIEERVKAYIELKQKNNIRAYQIIIEFFGEDLKSNNKAIEFDSYKKVLIKKYIKELEEFINLSKEEYESAIANNTTSLIDEIRIEGYTDEQIVESINKCLPYEGELHDLIINSYGNEYNKKVEFNTFDKNEYYLLKYFITRCKKYLTGELTNIRSKKSGYNLIINPDLSENEKRLMQERLTMILERKRESKSSVLLEKILKDNLPISSIEDKQDQLSVRSFIKTIKDELEDFSYSKYFKDDEIAVLTIPEDLSVIASLVLKFTKLYRKPEIVSEKLHIPTNEIIKVYLDNSNCIDLETLMIYIVYHQREFISDLLAIEELKNTSTLLTNKEKELIYLYLMSKTDETMSNKEISHLTGLQVSEIKEYTIMTQDDNVNKLNLLLHKIKRNK